MDHPLNLKPETRTLLNALVLLKGRPAEDILHEAVVKLFGDIAEKAAGSAAVRQSASDVNGSATALSHNLADRIRDFVLERYVQPARDRGDKRVELVVREVHRAMGLEQRHPAVIGALQSRAFLRRGQLKLMSAGSSGQNSSKVLRFELL